MRLEILNALVEQRSLPLPAFAFLGFPLLDIRAVLENMLAEGYVTRGPHRSDPYRITNTGREYRLALQQALDQKRQQDREAAAEKAEQKALADKNRKQDLRDQLKVALITSFITVPGTLLAEHFEVVVQFLKDLLLAL